MRKTGKNIKAKGKFKILANNCSKRREFKQSDTDEKLKNKRKSNYDEVSANLKEEEDISELIHCIL